MVVGQTYKMSGIIKPPTHNVNLKDMFMYQSHKKILPLEENVRDS